MKVEKLTDNTYRVRKVYKGRRYTAYFDHIPDEKEVFIIMADKMKNTEYGQNKGSFGAYCYKYIDSKVNVLSPSTIGGYKKIVRTLSEGFKNKNLYDIEQIDIQNEVNSYAVDHSPKSVRNLHGFISAVLGVFRPNMKIHTTLPQKRKFDGNTPTTEGVKMILEASKGTPYHIAFQLAVLGMRRSEICAATPADIHGHYLTINKTRLYDEDNHLTTRDNTKTEESTRKIYLPDALIEEIKQAGVIYDRTPPMLVHTLHKYQDELNLPRFRLHDLRAFYVSYAHAIGIPDAYIMESGGWRTDYVMKTVYRKTLSDKNAELQTKIANGLFE